MADAGCFKFLLRSTISGPIVRLIARSIADHWNAEMGGEAPSVLDDVRILCMLNSESLPQWNPTCKGKNLGARAVAFKLHFGRAFNAFLSRLIAFSQHRSGRIIQCISQIHRFIKRRPDTRNQVNRVCASLLCLKWKKSVGEYSCFSEDPSLLQRKDPFIRVSQISLKQQGN